MRNISNNNAGNVAIGTASPSAIFEVKADDAPRLSGVVKLWTESGAASPGAQFSTRQPLGRLRRFAEAWRARETKPWKL